MPRALMPNMLAHIHQHTTTLCSCVKVTGPDAVVWGFTSHTRDLTIDGVLYRARTGILGTSTKSSVGSGVDNLNVMGLLRATDWTSLDLIAGKYNQAPAELFLVNYMDVSLDADYAMVQAGTSVQIPLETAVAGVSYLCGIDAGSPVDPQGRQYEGFQDFTYGGYPSMFSDGEYRDLSTTCTSRRHGMISYLVWNGTMASSYIVLDMTAMTTADLAFLHMSNNSEGAYRLGFNFALGAISGVRNVTSVRFDIVAGQVNFGTIPLLSGNLGAVKTRASQFEVEFRSISQKYSQQVVPIVQLDCRYRLGDAGCKFNLASETFTGTAATVTNDRQFTAAALVGLRADDWFNFGKLTWTNGAKNGMTAEVKDYVASTGTIVLQQAMLHGIDPGDTFTVSAGCNKLFSTCDAKFSNTINYGGEPDVPGNDYLLKVAKA